MFISVVPGVVLVCVMGAAAAPAYVTLRASRRGRARSAVAYLSGFFVGIATTVLVFVLLRAAVTEGVPQIGHIGLVASFWGPFFGMGRAKWQRPHRRSVPGLRSTNMELAR